jgi:hypothetical protein
MMNTNKRLRLLLIFVATPALLIVALMAQGYPTESVLAYISSRGAWIPWAAVLNGQSPGYALRAVKLYCQSGSTIGPCNPSGAPLFFHGGFGDSYVLGSGASNPLLGGGFSQLAKSIPSVPSINYGVSGANSDAINLVVWTKVQANPQLPSAFVLDGGANDGPNCGTSAACITNFKEEVDASIGRLTIPNQERVMGSTCTQTSGTWTADTAVYNLPAPAYYLNPGTAVSNAASSSVLTCTVTARVASRQVGWNFQVTNAQTGTFTVSVDGVAQTDQCSATTTFTSGPCGGLTLLTGGQTTTIFRQEGTGTLGLTHTVVFTKTNAAKVNVTAVDTITPTAQPNSNYVIPFGPNLAFANAALYNAAMLAVAGQFTTDGALVKFGDIQSTTNPGPGVNNTTDISQTATTNCPASANLNHPNDVCGYLHLAQTIANAAKAAGWNIYGNPQAFNSLIAPVAQVNGGPSFAYYTQAVSWASNTVPTGCSVVPGGSWTVPASIGITSSSHIGYNFTGDPGNVLASVVVTFTPTNSSTVVGRVCNWSGSAIVASGQTGVWYTQP